MNNQAILSRLSFDLILFLALLFAPWWLPALLALFGMLYFEKFYEALLAALMFDALFGLRTALGEHFSFQYFFFIAALAVYFLTAFVKTRLR